MLGRPLTPIVGRNGNVVAPINVLDIRIQHDPRIALRNSVAHHSINQTSESSRMLVRDEPIIWSPPIERGVGVKSAQCCVLGRHSRSVITQGRIHGPLHIVLGVPTTLIEPIPHVLCANQ